MTMPIKEVPLETLRVELRRGSVVVAVLGALREEGYGYALRVKLGHAGLPIEEGGLYPLLRRLAARGLLTSEWRGNGAQRKRFYQLSPAGAAMLDRTLTEWRGISGSIARLTEARDDVIS